MEHKGRDAVFVRSTCRWCSWGTRSDFTSVSEYCNGAEMLGERFTGLATGLPGRSQDVWYSCKGQKMVTKMKGCKIHAEQGRYMKRCGCMHHVFTVKMITKKLFGKQYSTDALTNLGKGVQKG